MISILIIGNEILSNQVKDHNLKVMLEELNARSYPIDEVRIVRDDLTTISRAVRELSDRSRFLISTGGVGPTHDDITLEAYAHAFEMALAIHPQQEARLRAWAGDKPLNESMLRMARMPAETVLIELGPHTWPLVQVRNCFVLPGLPEVFDKKFKALLEVLPPAAKRYFAEVLTRADETEFAAGLTVIQQNFADVEVGSYPTYNRADYAAQVTFKGTDRAQVAAAHAQFEQLIRVHGSLVRSHPPV